MNLLKQSIFFILLIVFSVCKAQTEMTPKPALPSPQQVQWQNMEHTMFVHFAPNAWKRTELDDRSTPLSRLNTEKLDVNQWIDAAESFKSTFLETFPKMKSFPKTFPVINRLNWNSNRYF